MKKYIILSFLFLLISFPVLAKASPNTQKLQQGQASASDTTLDTNNQGTAITSAKNSVVSPTGNQIKNQNEIQTQNQGEDQQLSVKIQENGQLDQAVDESLVKVSDQVQELVKTVGIKSGIGPEVKEIAQSQTKLQDEIKSDFEKLNSRGTLAKLLVGSDKKVIKLMEQKMEQNRLMVQQFEELKLQTKNSGDLQQLQETIDLVTYQNISLQNKVDKENKINGMFGWLINLFN